MMPCRMVNCGFHPSANNPFRVEENERIIADPSSIPAAVFDPRRHAQRLANPADRLIDLTVSIGAQIKDVDPVCERLIAICIASMQS